MSTISVDSCHKQSFLSIFVSSKYKYYLNLKKSRKSRRNGKLKWKSFVVEAVAQIHFQIYRYYLDVQNNYLPHHP